MSGRYPSPGYHDESGYDEPGYRRVPSQGYPAHDSPPSAPDDEYARYRGYPDYVDYRDVLDRQSPPTEQPERESYYADPPTNADPQTYADPPPTRAETATAPRPVLAAPPRRRHSMTIALAVVVAVLGLCGVGGWLIARPYLAEWPATLSKPDRLAGLELSTEPALAQSANEIAAGMRRDVKVDGVVAAFYHDPAAEQRLVGLVGSTAFIMSPKAELDEAFRGDRGMAITGVRDIDPGLLGGLARCGSADRPVEGAAAVPVSVCAWADHGSFVIGIFYHRPVDESAELLRTIRGEILHR